MHKFTTKILEIEGESESDGSTVKAKGWNLPNNPKYDDPLVKDTLAKI